MKNSDVVRVAKQFERYHANRRGDVLDNLAFWGEKHALSEELLDAVWAYLVAFTNADSPCLDDYGSGAERQP